MNNNTKTHVSIEDIVEMLPSAHHAPFQFYQAVIARLDVLRTTDNRSHEEQRALTREKDVSAARMLLKLRKTEDLSNPLLVDAGKPTQAAIDAFITANPDIADIQEQLDACLVLRKTIQANISTLQECSAYIKCYIGSLGVEKDESFDDDREAVSNVFSED